MDSNIFALTCQKLLKSGFMIRASDLERPWGGFFVIEESQAQLFANLYFDGLDVSTVTISGKLSPKLLLVAPGKRLSWQYHNRRAEIWRVVKGEAGIVRSNSNEEGPLEILTEGSVVTLKQGERHRLIGLTDWAVIAEIWQHTDALNPSDEEDIIRLQDDFGR
jgi:mannose-6-phosphate isomerase-like protein (cupin superfamily)